MLTHVEQYFIVSSPPFFASLAHCLVPFLLYTSNSYSILFVVRQCTVNSCWCDQVCFWQCEHEVKLLYCQAVVISKCKSQHITSITNMNCVTLIVVHRGLCFMFDPCFIIHYSICIVKYSLQTLVQIVGIQKVGQTAVLTRCIYISKKVFLRNLVI